LKFALDICNIVVIIIILTTIKAYCRNIIDWCITYCLWKKRKFL